MAKVHILSDSNYFQYARNFATLFLFSIIRPLLALTYKKYKCRIIIKKHYDLRLH